MSKAKSCVDGAILVFLMIFFITEHHYEFTAIKNLSLYLCLFLALLSLGIWRSEGIENLKFNFKNTKFALIFALIFLIYSCAVSIFPYTSLENFNPLGKCFSMYFRGLAIIFIVSVWFDGSKNKLKWLFIAILMAFVFVSVYFLEHFIRFYDEVSVRPDKLRDDGTIYRSYAVFVDRFLAFGIAGIFIFKNKFLKIAVFLLCVFLPIVMDIYTGARGSYLAALCAIFGFAFFIAIKHKNLVKWLALSIFLGGICVGVFAANSDAFERKMSQRTNITSNRTALAKERVPLLIQSGKAIFGLGHGYVQYDKFLSDQKAAGKTVHFERKSVYKNAEFHFFNDEPFFIGNAFYYGFVGCAMLFAWFCFLLFSSFKGYQKTGEILYLALFLSVLCYFGIRGIFECTNLQILYLFYMSAFLVMINSKVAKNGAYE